MFTSGCNEQDISCPLPSGVSDYGGKDTAIFLKDKGIGVKIEGVSDAGGGCQAVSGDNGR